MVWVINLKKLLFLFTVLALFMTSCSVNRDMSAYMLMSRLGTENGYIYVNDCDVSSINYISPERLGYLYYGESTALCETDITESFCIYISRSIQVSEIHIFKAKHQSDVEALKRMLESRKKLLSKSQINPSDTDFISDTATECHVFFKGRFVFLTAGGGNDIIPRIEKLF